MKSTGAWKIVDTVLLCALFTIIGFALGGGFDPRYDWESRHVFTCNTDMECELEEMMLEKGLFPMGDVYIFQQLTK